jgi:hypothetical protein
MMNSHVQFHICEFIVSMNSSNTNIFPPLSIKVISMSTTAVVVAGGVVAVVIMARTVAVLFTVMVVCWRR